MEEREALKREIELLQNLIDEHKSIHGDTPFASVQQRLPEALRSVRGRNTAVVHSHSSRGRLYASQGSTSWRKTYSLRNKNPQSSVGHPSFSTSSSVRSQNISLCSSTPSHSRGEQSVKTAILSSGVSPQTREGRENSVTQIQGVATERKKTDALKKTGPSVFEPEDGNGGSNSTGVRLRHEIPLRQTEKSQHSAESSVVLPEKKASVSSEVPSPVKALVNLQGSPQVQNKPSLTSKVSADTKGTICMVQTPAALTTGSTVPPLSALPKVSKQPSCNPTSHNSYYQVRSSFLKKSKFTWVKSQNEGGEKPKQASCTSSPTVKAVSASPTSVSKTGTASITSHTSAISKRTPAKKFPRKLSPVIVASKISKYRWVSSSVGVQAKISRKSLSPKASTLPHRALEKSEANKKFRVSSAPSAKIRKEIVGSSATSSRSSCYRWRAGDQSAMVAVTEVATVPRRKSAFHWTSEKNNREVRGGLVGPPSVTQRTSLTPSSSSPGAFKLRSTMKIIRKTVNSGGGSVKGTSSSAVKFSLRGRTHSSTRSPMGARRTPPRELVSFGRHKLRRLSTSFSRTSPFASSSHREPGSRFKTRLGSSSVHTLQFNPALSWRAKRIQSARSFLQSRLRVPHYRHPSSTHPWRGSSMCWIRGSLYRVSANKLYRTVTSSISINRTGRSFSSAQASSMSAALNRTSSTRHLASRAVQRSLAIIRHANQKKQPKQYCMYYNRFGKCNRGNSCPYIHDPDKVAVCTRFLRGTCKQAAGTCPFSHKVAKEKMPVCSYFLKGICNNSDCPYSHVYVSRKAEVCEEFVKGYCPEGEKCKKKHTLVCPDFSKAGSCPRGARCKLQHHQRAKRSSSSISTTPGKRARTKDSYKRPCLSFPILQDSQAEPGSPTKGPLALPSFISLSNSPEEADAPDTVLAETSQVKEKKLQIKPRL